MTAIWIAGGYPDIAADLVNHGADVNCTNDGEVNALMMAVNKGYLHLVKLIAPLTENVGHRNIAGESAMDWAEKGGHQAIADYLRLL